jgi:hypothetical protein
MPQLISKVILFIIDIKERKNGVKKYFFGIIFIVISIYIVLIIDTHSLMKRAKKIFLLQKTEIEVNDELNFMYSPEYVEKKGIGNIELNLSRLFTLHNFKKGIIIIRYTHVVYDTKGEILTGSWDIFPVIWKIEKINKIWNVVEIKEDP